MHVERESPSPSPEMGIRLGGVHFDMSIGGEVMGIQGNIVIEKCQQSEEKRGLHKSGNIPNVFTAVPDVARVGCPAELIVLLGVGKSGGVVEGHQAGLQQSGSF